MTQSHESPGRWAARAPAPPLSRWEVLGAWLHVWTPPRDAQVPPVPWRRIGIWSAVAVVLLGVAAAIAVPRIDSGKRESAARDARELAKLRAAERARIVREQRVHGGRADGGRSAVYGAATAAVLGDARARVHSGELSSPVSDLVCDRAEGAPPPGRVGAYDCTAITGRIAKGERNSAGLLGYPFRLKVDYARGTYVWCKQNPLPGEQVVPDPSQVVPLPRACRV
jgi:hypothetical protein